IVGPISSRATDPFPCAPVDTTSVPGVATLVCHAAQLTTVGQFFIPVTPTPMVAQTISGLITLTQGTTVVQTNSFQLAVLKPDSAELSLFGSNDGSVFVGSSAN